LFDGALGCVCAAKFLWYLLFMFLTFTYYTMYGIMAVGLTSSQMLAAVMATIFYSLWNLFSGFLIPFPVSTKKWQNHSLSCLIIKKCQSIYVSPRTLEMDKAPTK
jgi:hypothetical protein